MEQPFKTIIRYQRLSVLDAKLNELADQPAIDAKAEVAQPMSKRNSPVTSNYGWNIFFSLGSISFGLE